MELGTNHLLQHWAVLRRRRWVVVLAVVAVTLAALVGSFLVTPLYRSTVTLQVERLNPDVLSMRELAQVDYSWSAYTDYYQTQYKIIASMDVARRAVEQIGLASHPAFDVSTRKPSLLARLAGMLPRKSSAIEQDPVDVAAAAVLARLDVTPVRNSQLVRISWVSEEPELAARVASAVADAYIRFNMQSQYSTTDQAREFLVDQIGTLKHEITAIEERLQSYGESKGIVSIDGANNVTLRALQSVSDERTQAQTTLAASEAHYRAVREAPPEALLEVLQSELIARLRGEYAAYEAEYSEAAKRFKDDWPGLQTLSSRLTQAHERLSIETDRIAGQVRATAAADYEEALAAVRNLDALLATQERAAQGLKRDAIEYANLESDVDKRRETLAALLQRQNEMALATRLKGLDSTASNIRVMERARTPPSPFRPRVKLNLLLGLLLGLGLGVAMVYVLEYVDNTISSPFELERLVDMPVLATIPRHGESGSPLARVRQRRAAEIASSVDLVAHRDRRAGVAEAYRGLRTSILLSHAGQPPRRVMVTSAVPEEGKTATLVNLAVVLAQLGRRVLVVDTDLRRPRLHSAFEVENVRGVTNYLSGMRDDALSLVVPSGIDGLDVLPSGPIPPNPSELLNSEIFAELGGVLVQRGYDHVLFDSPPVLSVSDPVIISSVVDLSILVVRASSTPRQSVRLAAEQLRRTGSQTRGAVLNGLSPQDGGVAYDYYGRYEALPEETAGRASGAATS